MNTKSDQGIPEQAAKTALQIDLERPEGWHDGYREGFDDGHNRGFEMALMLLTSKLDELKALVAPPVAFPNQAKDT